MTAAVANAQFRLDHLDPIVIMHRFHPSSSSPCGSTPSINAKVAFTVFVGGVAYIAWYKKNVLGKYTVPTPRLNLEHVHATIQPIWKRLSPWVRPCTGIGDSFQQKAASFVDELTFDKIAMPQETMSDHMQRREQDWIDRVVLRLGVIMFS